jgi:hypothetical protein
MGNKPDKTPRKGCPWQWEARNSLATPASWGLDDQGWVSASIETK